METRICQYYHKSTKMLGCHLILQDIWILRKLMAKFAICKSNENQKSQPKIVLIVTTMAITGASSTHLCKIQHTLKNLIMTDFRHFSVTYSIDISSIFDYQNMFQKCVQALWCETLMLVNKEQANDVYCYSIT